MEDNKYYVPDISEFHVGFEFLWKYKTDDSWKIHSLTDGIFGDPDYSGHKNPHFYSREGIDFRVKYLDKEDIEAEGFKRDSGDCDFIKGEFQIELFDGKVYITDQFGAKDLFFGVIKNRSELRRVLKMIGA